MSRDGITIDPSDLERVRKDIILSPQVDIIVVYHACQVLTLFGNERQDQRSRA